jgi:hypothetical protein
VTSRRRWCGSSPIARTVERISSLIDAEVFPRVASILVDSEYEIKKEALMAICNAVSALP